MTRPGKTDHAMRVAKSGDRSGATRIILLAVVVVAIGFALIQLIPARITNPSKRAEPPWDSPRTRQLSVAACFDCHSNQTRSYWYEKVAPISWWIKNHVDEGRRALNFSEYDPNRHRSGNSIARRVDNGSMPPSYYTWLGRHPDAKLTAAEKADLVAGLEKTYGSAVGVTDRGDRGGNG
jgi:hypothetical protein